MRSFTLLITLILIGLSSVFAQKGDFFLHSYQSPISNTDNQNFSAIQGSEGIMYFANTKGVITYDGVHWKIINTLSTPYALTKSQDGTIYVGCSENFGYLSTNLFGKRTYKSISYANKDFGEITHVLSTKDKVYFYSERVVFAVSQATKKVENYWMATQGDRFRGMFLHQERVFVNSAHRGLQYLKDGKLVPFKAGQWLSNQIINTSLVFDPNKKLTLVGTDDNLLYLFDGQKFEPYEIEAQSYLEESLLTNGINLSDQTFVLSTLSGGCLIIHKPTGKTEHTINYQTGLSDDEVLSICKDQYGGLWICNANGITRADVELPILRYSGYPGLEGEITAVSELDKTLYVGTSEGVFYLAKVDKFDQIVTLIKKEKEIRVVKRNIRTTIKVKDQEPEPEPDQEENPDIPKLGEILDKIQEDPDMSERKRQRLERRAQRKARKELKRLEKEEEETEVDENEERKNNDPTTVALDTLTVVEEVPVETRSQRQINTEYVDTPIKLKETYALQSIPYIFNKVEGISVKCKQLLPFLDNMLVATTLGLYEITENTSSRLILRDASINYIYASPQDKERFYVATDRGLISILYQDDIWKITHRLTDFGDSQKAIHSVVQEGAYLWLGGDTHIYRVKLDARGNPEGFKKYDLPNDFVENAVVRVINKVPVFILSSGIYTYDQVKDDLVRDKDLIRFFNPRSPIIYAQPDYTWIKPLDGPWIDVQRENAIPKEQTVFLSFFSDIQNIYVGQRQNIWVVGDNALYKIKAEARMDFDRRFHILISRARHKKTDLPLEGLRLPYQKNSIKLELAAPFFLREAEIQYQYRLEGLEEEWSEWDNESDIFAILPSGDYKLRVRAKNIFGQLSEEKVFAFAIARPFWQAYWFILIVIVSTGGIFYGLIKLRTRALTRANQRLEIKVDEKTKEISQQKQQLEVAFHEISEQKNQIQLTNRELKKVNLTLEQKVEERTAKLKATLFQLLQTNKELDTFIYRSSHDLRGPISRLIGLVNLAKMEDDRASILKNLNLIEFTAKRMSKMLDKLMNVHSINSDSTDYERFDLQNFLDDMRNRLKDIPGSDAVYIIFKIEGKPEAYTDEVLLGVILENLLENAIQFQDPSPEVFSIVKLNVESDADHIYLNVTDNGLGIPPEHQDQIFDMFHRASERSQGNGLGLYLVKKATEKLGGRIEFKSESGNVTSFRVILPQHQAQEEAPEPVLIGS